MDINDDFIYTTIGKKIKEYRDAKGLTQEDLAKDIGFSRTSLANFESGKQAVYISDLYKLAVRFGIQITDLCLQQKR
jgi:transcriptional regulator with XRE-family HTH domain